MQKTDDGEALLVADMGMEGDAHFGFGHRQVSLLNAEAAAKIREKVPHLKPGDFAENLLIEDFDLARLSLGDRVRVGETELEVTQIGKECHSHCAIYEAAGDCIMPRLGIFCRVLRGGTVRAGDAVGYATRVAR
ncbi:MAG: MOSC domain-containing protein [Synergistaceae bacterium]|jgi:MOSC domain-containing protein YiiM|nr:MOSC domain-containing protein [Synergistaceae bacterium]